MGQQLMGAKVRQSRPSGSWPEGQTLVEFALVIPLVLVLFMAVFDLGILAFQFNAISDAARNGLREAIVDQDCSAIDARARSAAQTLDLTAASAIQVTIYKSAVVSATPNPDSCSGGLGGGYGIGYLAEVRVQATYHAITPIIGQLVGPITISSTARLPIERAFP
jgi:Flp pilus assembly protein TadG